MTESPPTPTRVRLVAYLLFTVEIFVISFVGWHVYTWVNGEIMKKQRKVTPIRKEFLMFPDRGELKYFYELIPNAIQTEHPEWLPNAATYTFNSDGLNERFEYPTIRTQGGFRIITLGDSFTFGQYVDTEKNWPEQLEVMLNSSCSGQRFEVINLGIYGYDLQYAAERFSMRGAKYSPDLVLWLLLGERVNEVMRPIVQKLEASAPATLAQLPSYPAWRIALDHLMKTYSHRQLLEQERLIMRNFTDMFDKHLVFMLFSSADSQYKARIKVHSSEREYPTSVFDSLTDIVPGNGGLPDGHPNQEGHARIAKETFAYLVHKRLIPCGQ